MLGFAEELFVKSRLDSRLASLSRCPSKRLDHSCSCSSPNHEGAVGPVLFSNSHYIHSIMKKSSRATSPTTLSFMAMALSMLPSPLLAVAVTCIRYASRALVGSDDTPSKDKDSLCNVAAIDSRIQNAGRPQTQSTFPKCLL
jgi:hypothetical protein